MEGYRQRAALAAALHPRDSAPPSTHALSPLPLLPGDPPEAILAEAEHVTLVVPPLAWTESPGSVFRCGRLLLTSYRVLFAPDDSGPLTLVDMPLLSIHRFRCKFFYPDIVRAAASPAHLDPSLSLDLLAGHQGTASAPSGDGGFVALGVLKLHGKDTTRVLRLVFGRLIISGVGKYRSCCRRRHALHHTPSLLSPRVTVQLVCSRRWQ